MIELFVHGLDYRIVMRLINDDVTEGTFQKRFYVFGGLEVVVVIVDNQQNLNAVLFGQAVYIAVELERIDLNFFDVIENDELA